MTFARRFGQKGEGKAGCIFGALVLLLAVYLAFKFIPVKIAFADIKDTATKAADMGSIKKDDVIRREIMDKFKENRDHVNPIKDQDINITRSADTIRVSFTITKDVELIGGKIVKQTEKVDYACPLF